MTDLPILFSGAMVRALLAGRKTQTRRIIKPQPFASGYYDGEIEINVIPANDQYPKAFRFNANAVEGGAILEDVFEPRINAGDRLWVKENHYLTDDGDDEYAVYVADGSDATGEHLHEVAALEKLHPTVDWSKHKKQRPSIHMPRWASRITLIVTDVRVERLQDCSVADACAEGALVPPYTEQFANVHALPMYQAIWQGINGPGSWEANPWVAAYTFTVIKQNIDQIEKVAA